jgi:hypothetical protein
MLKNKQNFIPIVPHTQNIFTFCISISLSEGSYKPELPLLFRVDGATSTATRHCWITEFFVVQHLNTYLEHQIL